MCATNADISKWSKCVLVLCVVLAGGCAGVAPVEKMAKLDSQIASARQAEAIVYAPLELRFAEDKYKMAQAAMKDENYETANRFADEALLDAKLAEEKALSAQAQEEAQKMRESVESLRNELLRIQRQSR